MKKITSVLETTLIQGHNRFMVTDTVTITIRKEGEMARFNIEDYETVGERIARAHKDHPDLRLITNLVEVVRDPETQKPLQYIVKAEVWLGDILKAVDYAEEIVNSSQVNRTSALENACTSAIGRALADANYQGTDPRSKRPSREEMEKVARNESAKVTEIRSTFTEEQTARITQLSQTIPTVVTIDELRSIDKVARQEGIILGKVGLNTLAELIKQKKMEIENASANA